MTDPTPAEPHDAALGANQPGRADALQPLALSLVGRVQRLHRSLTPWVQRMLAAASPGSPSAGAGPAAPAAPEPAQEAPPFTTARGRPTVGSSLTLSMVQRVQRVVERGPLIQEQPQPGTARAADRFASNLVQRFPDVTEKYHTKQPETPETVQRAPLPYVGEAAPSAPSALPPAALPAAEADAPALDFPPIAVSPDDSVAAQLGARLQAYRNLESSPEPASPRQIGRKALEAAAPQRAKAGVIRRSKIEELPASQPKPAAERRPAAAGPRPPVARQSKPAPPGARPAPPAPAIQRAPAIFQPGPESEDVGPRPELPSLAKQLGRRLKAQRALPAAEAPPPGGPTPSAPAVQRKPEEPQVVEHREARSSARRMAAEHPGPEPNAIQRAPGQPDAPASPTRSEEPLTLRRKMVPEVQPEKPDPVEPISQTDGGPSSVAGPQDQPDALTPAVPDSLQRTPIGPEPTQPELPVAPKRAQRKAAARQPQAEMKPTQKEAPTPPAEPARPSTEPAPVQRKPARTAAAPLGEPEPRTGTEPVANTPEPAPPADARPALPDAPHSGPAAQRTPAESSEAPAPEQPRPSASATLGESVLARARSSEALPLSRPPQSIQRTPAPAPARPEAAPEPASPADAPTTSVVASSARERVSREPLPKVDIVRRSPGPQAGPPALASKDSTEAPAGEPLSGSVRSGLTRSAVDTAVLPQARIQRDADTEEAPAPLAAPASLPLAAPEREARQPAVTGRAVGTLQRAVERRPSSAAEPQLPLLSLPLAPARERIQREPTKASDSASTTTSEPESDELLESNAVARPIPKAKLLDLARRIYPLLKRMLAVERERRSL